MMSKLAETSGFMNTADQRLVKVTSSYAGLVSTMSNLSSRKRESSTANLATFHKKPILQNLHFSFPFSFRRRLGDIREEKIDRYIERRRADIRCKH